MDNLIVITEVLVYMLEYSSVLLHSCQYGISIDLQFTGCMHQKVRPLSYCRNENVPVPLQLRGDVGVRPGRLVHCLQCNLPICLELFGCILDSDPAPTDGAQYNFSVSPEICRRMHKSLPVLLDGCQNHVFVCLQLGRCMLQQIALLLHGGEGDQAVLHEEVRLEAVPECVPVCPHRREDDIVVTSHLLWGPLQTLPVHCDLLHPQDLLRRPPEQREL
mmetsp:Transcript_25858/g.74111  ORF Transcript_25858/g.74111 Transcript_25858/m.74111 type:complete len:218 (-) Transcript_25858:273-926(-)